ncbi:glycosyltransferase [Candidatus Nomurabacteria bacterium]|nr:glycosyltransferase [Candidatus Nomurabacteria bacterium]
MDIYYFSFTRFPSEKAHSLYMAKVCESFAEVSNNRVRLVIPRRFGSVDKPYESFYGVKNNFKLVKLPCVDLFYGVPFLKHATFFLGVVTYSISACIYTLVTISKESTIFSNDVFVAYLLTFFHKKVVYELHDYPGGKLGLYRRLFNRCYLIQTNNNQKIILLSQQFGVDPEKMYCAHNGVTIKDFDIQQSQQEARKRLGLNCEDKIVVYTGHLYDWKGADLLADVAVKMKRVSFLFIGGSKEDVIKMKNKYREYKNIHFLGFKPHSEIPLYQRAADVLVVPNTAKKEISRLHTSPMKIFEYMASKTPIVAADVPSIREILSEKNAFFFTPDDLGSLSNSIKRVLNLSDIEKMAVVNSSSLSVKEHSWLKRAMIIFERIKTN